MSVIDSGMRISQTRRMLDHLEIREELIRQLDDGRVKASEVAEHLKIPRSRVSEMRRRARLVQQDEIAPLAGILGLAENSRDKPAINVSQLTPVLSVVLRHGPRGGWREPDAPVLAQVLADALQLVPADPANPATEREIEMAVAAAFRLSRDAAPGSSAGSSRNP